jgi:hypothetical protein
LGLSPLVKGETRESICFLMSTDKRIRQNKTINYL